MSQIALRGYTRPAPSEIGQFCEALKNQLAAAPVVSGNASARVFSSESIDQAAGAELDSIAASMATQLTAAAGSKKVLSSESAAFTIGALAGGNIGAFAAREATPMAMPAGAQFVPASDVPNYLGKRVHSLEAYDNREARQAVLYTSAYNYSVARQDEFGETIWPTIVLGADQLGFAISVNRFVVFNSIRHKTDGSLSEIVKTDLVRAMADNTVLDKERTKLLPVVRPSSASKLVDPALVAPVAITTEGRDFETAPYAVGQTVDILGICQSDAQLAERGTRNQTDAVDPAVFLENLYFKVGQAGDEQAIKFNVLNMPGANFIANPQNQERERILNMTDGTFFIRPNTVAVDGTNLAGGLALVKSKGYTVVLKVSLAGRHNSEFGSTELNFLRLGLKKILKSDGTELSATDADYAAIAADLVGAAVVGYDLQAWLSNSNLRENGQFVGTTSFLQIYEVPLLSPITAQKPISTTQSPTADLENLVATTKMRMHNDAVTAILTYCRQLESFYGDGSNYVDVTNPPEILGAARFMVKPVFLGSVDGAALDITTLINSLTSADRLEDVSEGLVNFIREIAIQLYKQSEYKAACQVQGYSTEVTDVIVGCDVRIAPYIMKAGEIRDIGRGFRLRVVSTLDKRFNNKLFITFGQGFDNGDRNAAVNILNFGNCIWSSEVVYQAPISRDGQVSQETIVQPRYRFVSHLPVAAMLTLTGFEKIVAKLPIDFHQV